jgi:hypothetical protein
MFGRAAIDIEPLDRRDRIVHDDDEEEGRIM